MRLLNSYFFIWVSILLSLLLAGFYGLDIDSNSKIGFLNALANWDGGHFLKIAELGYSEDKLYAFFPLYPLVIKVVNLLIGNYLLSALLVNLLSTYTLIYVFYKFILISFNKQVALKALSFFLLFPASFFLITVYSESLFILFTLLTFYLSRQKRLGWATFFCVLAAVTRPVGIAVILGFLVDIYQRYGFGGKNWYVFLSPAGLLIYCLFLYLQTGNPFYFLFAEQTYWQRELTNPLEGFLSAILSLVTYGITSQDYYILVDLLLAIFGVGMVLRSFRFLPLSYSVYALLSVIIPLFTPTLKSMPRFLLPVFPIFILLALTKNKVAVYIYSLVSAVLLLTLSILFINGYWVG